MINIVQEADRKLINKNRLRYETYAHDARQTPGRAILTKPPELNIAHLVLEADVLLIACDDERPERNDGHTMWCERSGTHRNKRGEKTHRSRKK